MKRTNRREILVRLYIHAFAARLIGAILNPGSVASPASRKELRKHQQLRWPIAPAVAVLAYVVSVFVYLRVGEANVGSWNVIVLLFVALLVVIVATRMARGGRVVEYIAIVSASVLIALAGFRDALPSWLEIDDTALALFSYVFAIASAMLGVAATRFQRGLPGGAWTQGLLARVPAGSIADIDSQLGTFLDRAAVKTGKTQSEIVELGIRALMSEPEFAGLRREFELIVKHTGAKPRLGEQ